MTNPETLRYAAIMLTAGVGVPILAVLNAQLGRGIGSPPVAAVILFAVAALTAAATTACTTGFSPVSLLVAQPRHLLLAGVLIAFYVVSITWVAPRFGLGNAVFCVLLGQLAAASLIDHFALFGAVQHPLTMRRSLGLLAMLAGVTLVLQS